MSFLLCLNSTLSSWFEQEMISGGLCSFRMSPSFSHKRLLPPLPLSLTSRHRRLLVTATHKTEAKEKEKVIVISGPTGSGKTRLALELAKRLNGEIISADSVQVSSLHIKIASLLHSHIFSTTNGKSHENDAYSIMSVLLLALTFY